VPTEAVNKIFWKKRLNRISSLKDNSNIDSAS
jgi:hypothetical protein